MWSNFPSPVKIKSITPPIGSGTIFTYDLNGNRLQGSSGGHTDVYSYDYENRLVSLNYQTGSSGIGPYSYGYDYRTRRVTRAEPSAAITKITFMGGVSVEEYTSSASSPVVEYIRGHDYGGGVGGLEYCERSRHPAYNFYNSRGDVVTQTNSAAAVTFEAGYDAFGAILVQTGSTPDRQKANTKEQDPTGLINDGYRYRDPATGTFITRDPAGFVDGPNLYTYVHQNPWTHFDPEGLFGLETGSDVYISAQYAAATGGNIHEAVHQALETQRVVGTMAAKMLVGTAVAAGVAFLAPQAATAAVIGRIAVAAASGGAGGYLANAVGNKMAGQPINQGVGKAIAWGMATGVAAQGLGEIAGAGRGGAGIPGGKSARTMAADSRGATKTVGRWMSSDELAKMQTTGKVQEGGGGQTRVADPATPNTYKNPPKEDVYTEFDVPAKRVLPHSAGTGRIPGPTSPDARVPGRNPADYEMPKAENIKVKKPSE